MSVNAIDHIYVETRRFEESVAFWKTLSFSVAASWGGEGHRACRLVSEEAAVVLAEVDPMGQPQSATVHFAMSDPEALEKDLQASAAAEIVTPLADTHWGTRWIRVRDPDGNLYALEAPTQ